MRPIARFAAALPFALILFSFSYVGRTDGLVSTLSLVNTGSADVKIAYSLKNTSAQQVTVWHCGFWCNHKMIVTDASNKELQLTPFGQKARASFSPGGMRDKNAAFVLEPTEEDAGYEQYDPEDYFVFPMSGKYFVQYVYQEKDAKGDIEVWSNKLEINIKK